MRKFLYRYRFFSATMVLLLLMGIFAPSLAGRAVSVSMSSLREMLLVLPPVFILLGLLDVWVPRETMMRIMGHGSGAKGVLIALALGSATAGPLYGAFPVAAVFLKKGVSLRNVFIFLGAWSTTKVPMFLFELQSLGTRFALTRLLIDLPGIFVIAWIMSLALGERDKKEILRRAEIVTGK